MFIRIGCPKCREGHLEVSVVPDRSVWERLRAEIVTQSCDCELDPGEKGGIKEQARERYACAYVQ